MPRMGIKSSTRRVRGRSSKERYLGSMATTLLLDGGQVSAGHIGPLMAQETGDLIPGVKGTIPALDLLLVGVSGIGVPQAVVGHGPVRIRVLDLRPYSADELLKPVDSDVSGDTFWDEQLLPPGCDSQHFLQLNADALVDGYAPDFAAFTFDSEVPGEEGIFCRCRVQTEALVDAESGIVGQGGDSGIIFMSGIPALEDE